jgi:multimeric flavodoxin WrbA
VAERRTILLNTFLGKMLESDGMLLGSPSYF